MYKLFALPLLLCIGGLFIAATNTNKSEKAKNPTTIEITAYDLECMNVELKTQSVRCFGFCDGVLEVIVTGGQEPYTYQWSNGLTTNFSATLPTGEFSVTVTDAAGCEVIATANVGSPTEIKSNLQIEGSCDPNAMTTANVSPRGGVGNYNIEWSIGETGRSITNLQTGQTYSVTITTGGNGCSVTEEFTVSEGLTIDTEKTNIACGNDNTGTATATGLSGQTPYTYNWSTGFSETTDDRSTIGSLAAGTYTVTVTDAAGCEAIENIEIVDGSGLNLELESAPSTCKDDKDGMANVVPSGGTAPYRYEWSDGQTTGSAINLSQGTYKVTVTDILGCQQTGTVVVESNSNLEVNTNMNTSNGSVTVTASGGATPYTYQWNNGETTATSSGYEAGDEYSVTVTDALGCKETLTGEFPPNSGEFTVDITPSSPTCTNFRDGSLITTISGGTAPYVYEWNTGQSSPNLSGLAAGTYNVTVTDANGATASTTVTLSSPESITINIEPTSGDICDGTSTDYEANVIGGTAPYTYAWSNGNTSSTLSNVAAGDYFLTVTDANGCEKVGFAKVTPPFSVKVIGQAVRCADFCDGSVRAMVTGGKAPFTYVWSNGQTGQILEALEVGSYTVTVTDDNGCEAVATGEVTAPSLLEANLTINGTCEEGSELTASVNPMGGVGNYTILWSTGDTGNSISNLARGQEYTVKITDGNGCNITEKFTIPNAVGLVLETEKMDIACNNTSGGTATVKAISGTAPFTYEWSNGATETTDATTNSLTNLEAGTYTVTVTDTNDCIGTTTITIEETEGLILDTSSAPSTCKNDEDGMANVVPSGGTAPYRYEWSDGQTTGTAINLTAGIYSVTVTDILGCEQIETVVVESSSNLEVNATTNTSNGSVMVIASGGVEPYTYLWNNGATTATSSGYEAGDEYSVTVTDALGCEETVTGEFPPTSGELTIDITTLSPTCYNFKNGSIMSTVSGGTAPYTYEWNTGQSSSNINGLAGGTYDLTVTDANGLTASTTVMLINPDPITINIEPTSGDVCDGTNTDYEANATGGTAPYTYVWSNGNTSSTLSNVETGDYFLTVTDANNCEKVEYLKVNPPFSVKVIGQAVRCADFCDGSVRAMVTGGKAPFTYTWSNGQTGQILEGLPVGSYTVTVTDGNGCEATATGEVTAPPAIEANLTIDGTCEEGSEITASVNPTGGVGDFTIKWSTGDTGTSISDLVPGQEYTVKITDGNGCSITEKFTAPSTVGLVIETEKTDIACGNTSGGTATVNVRSGTAPFTYEWSNGTTETTNATSSTLTDLEAGTYMVTVTDAEDCQGTATITIEEIDGLVLNTSSTSTTCVDSEDGMANVVPSGGIEPYRYLWSDGQTTGTALDIAPGDYTVTVTDLMGCEGIATVTVEPGAIIEVEATIDATNNNITLTPSGGTSPYTFIWDNGETGATATNYGPGDTYSVKVTDDNGCMKTITGKIPEPENCMVTVKTTPTCEGESSGTATLSPDSCALTYTIDWGNGNTTITNTNLAGGTYTVTVTNSEGNSQVIEYTIAEISIEIVVTTTPEVCGTDEKGTATVSINGGNAPYNIIWSNGDTTKTTTGLLSGEYKVTVTDANGCEAITTTTVETVTNIELMVSVDTTGSTVTVTVTPRGGTGTYTYEWDNGETDSIAVNYQPCDTYSVTVTNENDCMETITGEIPCGNPLVVSVEPTPTCEGESDGTATLTINGGVPPYTIDWGNGTSEITNTGLAGGAYTVTVTDSDGNEKVIDYTIEEIILEITVSVTPKKCGSDTGGSASIEIDGGDAPYNIVWSNGQVGSEVSDLELGEYTVTVTDANGCVKEETVTIAEESTITSTIIPTPTQCGQANGTAMIVATGGTAPYEYKWSNDATGDFINGLGAGEYTVTITDANGCESISTTTIEEDNDIVLTTSTVNAKCEAAADGSATVEIAGGNEPYTIEWSTGEETATIENLAPGNYTVTITDADGCQQTTTVSVGEDNDLAGQVEVEMNSAGATGVVTVVPSGGTVPYTFMWDNGDTTATTTYLPGEEYSVKITDANGCMTTVTGKVPESENCVAVVKTTPTCEGEPNGTATLAINNCTPPFTIDWGNGNIDTTNTNLAGGNYTVTVTDSVGNERIIDYTIEEIILTITASVTPKKCGSDVGGAVTVEVGGGDVPYDIVWSNGQTESKINDLEPGEYTVTVTDANGCVKEETVTVTEEDTIEATVVPTMTRCAQATGTAIATPTTGTAPYTYEWSNGSTEDRISDLGAGEYTVTITDANACESIVTTTIEEDNDIVITSSKVDADCQAAANGSATIEIEGGDEPYTIEWSTGDEGETAENLEPGSYEITVTDANGCEQTTTVTVEEDNDLEVDINVAINGTNNGDTGTLTAVATGGGGNPDNYTYEWCTGATTATIEDLITGGYTVTVTDENGCTQTGIGYINTPPAIEIMPNCDGTANVTAIVGGCVELDINWDNGATGMDAIVENGIHTVTVTLPNGEIITTNFEVDAPQLEATVSSQVNATCEDSTDGSATATAMGGTAPYAYKWSNEAEGESIEDLAPGIYTVTVTDANDCETTASVTIEAEQEIDATVSGATACEGEEANPSVTNNNDEQTLTYQWMPAELFEEGTANSATPTFIGTENASVTVMIENEAGCTKEETVEIEFSERSMPDMGKITSEESCLGLIVNFNGGGETEGYIWRFGDPNTTDDISDEDNPTYTYSETGTYIVTLIPENASACQDTAKFEIMVEGEKELEFEVSGDPMVCGDITGIFSVDDTDLMAKWYADGDRENPLGEFNSIELGAGDYYVEVMNEEGCKGTKTFTVMDESLDIELNDRYSTCAGVELPIEIVNLRPGDLLEYEWTPNNSDLIDLSDPSNPVFTLEETTTFTSTISNQFGCSITRNLTIEVGLFPEIDSVTADEYTIILGQSTNLNVIGGEDNYTYTWIDDLSIDNPTREVTPEQTTVYTVEIMSPDGCIITRTVTVEVLNLACEEPYIFMPNAFTPNGDGNNDVIKVQGPHIEELQLMIYNRWGELVFETDQVDGEWDGRHQRTGEPAEGRVFGYYLMVRCIGGDTFTKKGNITLLR